MRVIQLLINEDVTRAGHDLEAATSENIVEICRENLRVLALYRRQLLSLNDIPELNLNEPSAISRDLIADSRQAVRSAIESTVDAQNLTEALLDSFVLISGWEAAETFNRLLFEGSVDWDMQNGEVCAPDRKRMKIEEAVETASRLRREAYVAHRIRFSRKADAAGV